MLKLKRCLGLPLVVSVLVVLVLVAFTQTNPFRQPSLQMQAERLIEEFNIERLPHIPQGLLQDLTLFFSNRQLAAIWDAAQEHGGTVTSWDQLKGREGLGETTLWKLYVFFDLQGSISEKAD